ncbi:MAG: hypothetical protein A2993_00535 [Gammaproteobacteria bacterium RIFCSPLOWO2_01_FULL_47_190]|nr:MAG: hypothetical protein A2993_00535 [Gammaproteobacteria bacterium RIFCSPLOWO2_01_FULL_47_190]OGT75555.1 MAG: hypothetical protein A2W76_10405 [Gammaproteobacteria bacterium RIFCSPLOWO2_12_47_11]OGT86132.1 MAG: hypothetical protein A3G42_04395 [Gammaproteobacteria bacterium RIFCSPLOWO2_12_FULL_47_76]
MAITGVNRYRNSDSHGNHRGFVLFNRPDFDFALLRDRDICALSSPFILRSGVGRGGVQEVIFINRVTIVIERGRQHPESRETFQRAWARVVLERF